MEKKYYKTQTILLEDPTYKNGFFDLDYYVLTTDINCKAGKKKVYGVEVSKKYIDIFGNAISQCADVKSITFDESEIYELISKLHIGTVTPLSLKDVVNDYISENNMQSELEMYRGA